MLVLGQDMPNDYQAVLKFLDRKGDFKSGVLKVNIPRNDLKMMIQGVSTPTPFGFGGWIAFHERKRRLGGDDGRSRAQAGRGEPSDVCSTGQRDRCNGTSQSLLVGRASRLLHACSRNWES